MCLLLSGLLMLGNQTSYHRNLIGQCAFSCKCVSMSLFTWTRDQVILLIGFYRERPELWNVRHKAHKDKNIIQKRYQEIEELMKPTVPFATIENIKKKMHTLQNQLNKEYKVYRESHRSGAGVDDVYVPNSGVSTY